MELPIQDGQDQDHRDDHNDQARAHKQK